MSVRRLSNHNDDNGDNGSDAVTPVSGLGLPTQGWSSTVVLSYVT